MVMISPSGLESQARKSEASQTDGQRVQHYEGIRVQHEAGEVSHAGLF